mgnify:CR=1 FL=1
MKRFLEILISALAGGILLFIYVKTGADKWVLDVYTVSGLAVAMGALYLTVRYYLKKYWRKKK